MKRARPQHQAPARSSFPAKGVRSRALSTWRAAARRIVRRALFSFPVTLRLGLEFDTADIQQPWWLPWFHSWHTDPRSERFSIGCRVGVLGVHLVVGLTVFNDEFAGDIAAAFFDEAADRRAVRPGRRE